MQAQDTPKLCECGCGQPAPIAKQTKTRLGHVQGHPVRFICGHAAKRTPHDYEIRDCGYETPCWVWVRATRPAGHGFRTIEAPTGRRTVAAHRLAWEKAHGPVSDGLQVHHLCENPPCVNPAHLKLVTPREHSRLHSPLDEEMVRCIRQRLAAGERNIDVAAAYGVTPATIMDIKRWRTWKDVA